MRDHWTCQAPGCSKALTTHNWAIHHIVPLSEGGDNSFHNLQAKCRSCYRSGGLRLVRR